MSDLISRKALLSGYDVRKVTEYDESGCGIDYKAVPVKAIKAAPAVVAVEVVRCKDCAEYIPWGNDRICGRVGSYYGNTKPNDYCSRGRKKHEE